MTGVLLRVLYLTGYPAGVNADEAYAGYEAYALLNNGTDSHGYSYPVYFISWGNGMNVLYSYLSFRFNGYWEPISFPYVCHRQFLDV